MSVRSSVDLSKVTVDGVEAVKTEGGDYKAANLREGDHEVSLITPNGERKFAVHTGNRPEIRIALSSDRDVGSILITTGLPDFQVELDGKRIIRKIRDGSMMIGNLAVKSYKIRVLADGYQPSSEMTLDVTKGGLAKQQLSLAVIPAFAILTVKGAPPKTQVLLDNNALGTTGDDGSFTMDRVSVGEHTVELRNAPQFKPAQFKRNFANKETVTISGSEARLERNTATIMLTATPEGVHFETRCGQGAPQRRPAPVTVSCGESQFSYRATLEGYREASDSFALTPGETYRKPVELAKVAVAVTKGSCSMADLAKRGWTLDDGWYETKSEGTLPCEDMLGVYHFAVRVPRGFAPKPVIWTIQSPSARVQFVLEKKSFSFRGGPKKDISKFDEDGHIMIRLTKEANRVVNEVKVGNTWEQLSTNAGDFRKSTVVFSKDARIAAFVFNER